MSEKSGKAKASALTLQVHGGFHLLAPDGGLIRITSAKAQALLAYLVLCDDLMSPRERLAGLLWSEKNEELARGSLRQTLRRLQKCLPEALESTLLVERDAIGVDRSRVSVDLLEMRDDLSGRSVTTNGLVDSFDPGRVLYGFDDLDPSFTAWLRVARAGWGAEFFEALSRKMRDSASEPTTRVKAADCLFRHDGANQEAARFLIESHIRSGDLPRALGIYKSLWDKLDELWGEEPAPDIQALVVEARSSPAPAPVQAMPVAKKADAPPGIVIQPFIQSGPWSMPDYFIPGFCRELTADLVRFREWVVLDASMNDHADFSLEGSYFESSDGAQLSIMVKDNRRAHYVASELLTVSFGQWSEAVRAITHRVSVALNLHVYNRDLMDHGPRENIPAGAFDIWLRANNLLLEWRSSSFNQAEALFEEVMARAPNFAPAYSSVASIKNTRHLAEPGRERLPEWGRSARDLAQKSVMLDPLDTRGQLALAWANMMTGHFSQAELHFGLSHDLNPINPQTMMSCAHGLSFCGMHEKANELADQALALSPSVMNKHWGYLACIRFFAGRYDEAVDAGERSGDAIMDIAGWMAAAHGQRGDSAEARRSAARFIERLEKNWSGEAAPTEENITRWFLRSFPVRSERDRKLMAEGLRSAGLPSC